MTTKVTKALKLTPTKIESLQSSGAYIKAGGSHNKVFLSGAGKQWLKNPNFIYVRDYRLMGTPAEVEQVLRDSGYDQNQINDALRNSYRRVETETQNSQWNVAYYQEVSARPKVEVNLADLA